MKNSFSKYVGFSLFALLCTGSFVRAEVIPLNRTEMSASYSMLFGDFGIIPGFTVGIDTPVGNFPTYQYLHLGGAVSAFFSRANGTLLDFDFVLRPQLPVKVGNGYLAFYASIPLGYTLQVINGVTIHGYNLSIVPGIRYFVDESWSFFSEVGFAYHGLVGQPNIWGGVFSNGVAYAF